LRNALRFRSAFPLDVADVEPLAFGNDVSPAAHMLSLDILVVRTL
jgi:hypothetical protein